MYICLCVLTVYKWWPVVVIAVAVYTVLELTEGVVCPPLFSTMVACVSFVYIDRLHCTILGPLHRSATAVPVTCESMMMSVSQVLMLRLL